MGAQHDVRLFHDALKGVSAVRGEGHTYDISSESLASEHNNVDSKELERVQAHIAQREADGWLDRSQGCLLGGAVGDALGYPIEFMTYESIQATFGEAGIRSYWLERTGGVALFSDDTQMTLFTAAGLLVGETRFCLRGIAGRPAGYIYRAYLDWLHTQDRSFANNPSDTFLVQVEDLYSRRAPGNTCLSALYSGKMGTMDEPLNHSKGCGGVMRVAPLGLACRDIGEYVTHAAEAAAITHGHPLGYIPSGALAYIVAECLKGERELDAIVGDCIEQLPGWFPQQQAYAREMGEQLSYARHLARNEAQRQVRDHDNIVLLGEGWVGDEALAIAVYCCLRHPDSFSEAVISAVNHGGDSDSTGAIAGNIMGASLGLSAIDAQWTEPLELRNVLMEVAKDLCDGCQMNSVMSDYRDERWLAKWAPNEFRSTSFIEDLLSTH